jgi:hypothetical protein
MRAKPVTGVIVPFVLKANGDAVLVKRPQLLNQTIVELLTPFALEKFSYGFAALEKFRAISPATILRVSERHSIRIAAIPGILGHADLLHGSFETKRRQWWTVRGHGGRPKLFVPKSTTCTDRYTKPSDIVNSRHEREAT